MSMRLTDAEIEALVKEPKELLSGSFGSPRFRTQNRHERADLEVQADSGRRYWVKLRRAELNPLDFSVVLAYEWVETGRLFLLRRYNGLSHEHQNVLDGEAPFYAYHIHQATERYQRSGYKEEHYARETERYVDLLGALQCLVQDCGFEPETGQADLFGFGAP